MSGARHHIRRLRVSCHVLAPAQLHGVQLRSTDGRMALAAGNKSAAEYIKRFDRMQGK